LICWYSLVFCHYETFSVEYSGECVSITATHEKEAGKLFGVYLWHKGILKWLEEGNKPVTVTVRNKWLMATFNLWQNTEKIYAEATFYKKVWSSLIGILMTTTLLDFQFLYPFLVWVKIELGLLARPFLFNILKKTDVYFQERSYLSCSTYDFVQRLKS